MTDFLGEIGGIVSDAVGDTLIDGIQSILYATVYKLLYYLAVGCCWIIDLLYGMFEVMAGLTKVTYNGDTDYLINVFFTNSTVSKVYWGMALIGMAVGFAFAIAAVIKKFFDVNDKEKRSYGQILGSLFKALLIIICMSLIITMVLNATTLLMQQISYIFINADDLNKEESITYTDEEYATMARVLNTIGNFSLNPSYNNRYNLNKCFNEIRPDLLYLMQQGVFDFHYVTTDMEGNTIATWQSALQKVANAASLNYDLNLDVYNESVSKALLETMELLRINGSFKPLDYYERQYMPSRTSVPMDRLLFLMASMRAAKNEDYNRNPSLTDPLRGAYYYGEKSIYDLDTVNQDFDIGITAFDYVILVLTCVKLLEMLVVVILNCVGRIFNMLLLYLISPLILGVYPLDDGAKLKQWTTAFVVQSLSVFGTVISMRVLLLFMPLVTDSALELFPNPIANLLGKLVVILGGFEVAEKATSLITGILADNAGWQSINAGDMSGAAAKVTAMGKAYATKAMGMGGKVLGGTLSGAAKVGGGALLGAGAVGLGVGYGVYGIGKGTYEGGKALAGKISAWREQRAQEKAAAASSQEPESKYGVMPTQRPDPRNEGVPGAPAPGSEYQKSSKISEMAERAGNHIGGPQINKSDKIAQMAQKVDNHNQGGPQINKSDKISKMAQNVDAHNAGRKEHQQSDKISQMAKKVDNHNQGAPEIKKSDKIGQMAQKLDNHNLGAQGVQKSDKIAQMAQRVDNHNQGAPQINKSDKIAQMAQNVDAHNVGVDAYGGENSSKYGNLPAQRPDPRNEGVPGAPAPGSAYQSSDNIAQRAAGMDPNRQQAGGEQKQAKAPPKSLNQGNGQE